MPRRDVMIVLGCWIALAFWARDAHSRIAVENPLVAVAREFVATDTTLARTFGAAPGVGRLVGMRGSPERPGFVFTLDEPHDGTEVEIRLYRSGDEWYVSELAVFAPDTVFLIARAHPRQPAGPLLAPSQRPPEPVDSVRHFVNRGGTEASRGDYAAALIAYENAYRIDPTNHDAAFWYATELARAGRHHEAMPILEGLMRRFPDRGEAYHTRAVMRIRLGQPDDLIASDLRQGCRRDYELACQTLDRNALPR